MQIGMIGLGRMGANMSRRLMKAGHECVAWDVHADSVKALLNVSAVTDVVRTARSQLRTAEDEYHYTQIRTCTMQQDYY